MQPKSAAKNKQELKIKLLKQEIPYFCCLIYYFNLNIMGRGDKRTKKGKIFKGTYGVSRPKTAAPKEVEKIDKKPE